MQKQSQHTSLRSNGNLLDKLLRKEHYNQNQMQNIHTWISIIYISLLLSIQFNLLKKGGGGVRRTILTLQYSEIS